METIPSGSTLNPFLGAQLPVCTSCAECKHPRQIWDRPPYSSPFWWTCTASIPHWIPLTKWLKGAYPTIPPNNLMTPETSKWKRWVLKSRPSPIAYNLSSISCTLQFCAFPCALSTMSFPLLCLANSYSFFKTQSKCHFFCGALPASLPICHSFTSLLMYCMLQPCQFHPPGTYHDLGTSVPLHIAPFAWNILSLMSLFNEHIVIF